VSRAPLLTAFLLAFASVTLSALAVPPLRGRVNDLAGLIPTDRERALEKRLEDFETKTSHQIAVLTIPSLEGEDLEGFSLRVAESWKLGKKGFDNGVLLLVAKNDRKLRIEVGYGLEGVLPDALASRIIREVIVPRFRANDFAGGIEAGLEAIMKATQGEPLPAAAARRTPRQAPLGNWAPLLLFLLPLLAMGLWASLSHDRRIHNPWSGGRRRRYDYWGSGLGGGDFTGGGNSGGGGGFGGGGGGFGGGGASGSW
jgi:uncharacterized protein